MTKTRREGAAENAAAATTAEEPTTKVETTALQTTMVSTRVDTATMTEETIHGASEDNNRHDVPPREWWQ